ncbi:hypothetical protein D9M72_456630 [compost metagenome]
MRAARNVHRGRVQGEVGDVVVLAGLAVLLLGPQAPQDLDEFLGSHVAFVVFQPLQAEVGELVLEPAGDDVDGGAAVGDVVRGDDVLGQHAGVPHAGVDGRNDLQPLRGRQQGQAEGGRLVLLVSAVGGGVPGLGQGVLEAGVLGDPGQLFVVVEVPAGALFDGGDHQAAGNVRHPVGELEWFGKTGNAADVVHDCSFTSVR